MRLHAPAAQTPDGLTPLAHVLGDALAVFLPGPGSTHVLHGATRWLYETVQQAPARGLDLAALRADALSEGLSDEAFDAALDTLLQARLLAQSGA